MKKLIRAASSKSNSKRIVPRAGPGRPNIARLNTFKSPPTSLPETVWEIEPNTDDSREVARATADDPHEIAQQGQNGPYEIVREATVDDLREMAEDPTACEIVHDTHIPTADRSATQGAVRPTNSICKTVTRPSIQQIHDPVVHERVKHIYRHVKRTTINNDRHETVHQHVIQPIQEVRTREDPDVSTNVSEVDETSDGPAPVMAPEEMAKYKAVYARLAETATTEPPQVSHQYIDEDPEINQRIIRHVIQEVHPIVERDVYIIHVIHENKTVNKTEVETDRISGLHIADPITMHEWQTRSRPLRCGEKPVIVPTSRQPLI